GIQLGDAIRLLGYDRPATVTAGAPFTITLFWEATRTIEQDLVVFVHVWQPGDPRPLLQNDSRPRQGWFPTTEWRAGDVVEDIHILQAPGDITPETYPLWAGLYRPQDGVRLPANGPDGPLPHDLIPLGNLTIAD
ncbi:MAG: hypothetical protein JXB35_07850, partial [Anaerolineae bacterium]|nr:hypothetical protein [Anaerolineae bacterium]